MSNIHYKDNEDIIKEEYNSTIVNYTPLLFYAINESTEPQVCKSG